MGITFDIVAQPCIAFSSLLCYLPPRPDTFERDFVHPLLLTVLITEIPICRDRTVRFSFLKPVCRRLDLPCLKTCQWCKSHWSKSWSHALLLPPLSLLYCSIPGSVTDRRHFSLHTLMVWTRPQLLRGKGIESYKWVAAVMRAKSTSFVPYMRPSVFFCCIDERPSWCFISSERSLDIMRFLK